MVAAKVDTETSAPSNKHPKLPPTIPNSCEVKPFQNFPHICVFFGLLPATGCALLPAC
ncbi:hypothetical protein [Rubritalea tangerina]|uniref:hypothetical protein n=1 Tax=Rubritalea tangerina TaxID=430798 RepID=UPI0036087A7D